ncbi:hypothetical protein Y032_0100g3266 [Ancylostoma ceylanicum]|uniref:Uncharacterized protein n=1 Tax=Ancylostoma ceylanicum TaxID=53326 RepID=A0A016TIH4_9BILA|nr:hypothetical protein Y032_0100g3266 [Ancylostoma ceylanicum]
MRCESEQALTRNPTFSRFLHFFFVRNDSWPEINSGQTVANLSYVAAETGFPTLFLQFLLGIFRRLCISLVVKNF